MALENIMNLHLFDEGGDGGTETAGNGAGNGAEGNKGNGTYTYDQIDEIATARAERAQKAAIKSYLQSQGLSEEEALNAFNDYKKQKAAQAPDIGAITKERDEALAKVARMENETLLLGMGVNKEDLDYIMFKVSKMVNDKTDFKKAAESYLKENPRFSKAGTYRVDTSTGNNGSGSTGNNTNTNINDAIRKAMRR